MTVYTRIEFSRYRRCIFPPPWTCSPACGSTSPVFRICGTSPYPLPHKGPIVEPTAWLKPKRFGC